MSQRRSLYGVRMSHLLGGKIECGSQKLNWCFLSLLGCFYIKVGDLNFYGNLPSVDVCTNEVF